MSDSLEAHLIGLDDPEDPLTLRTIGAVLPLEADPDWAAAEKATRELPLNLEEAAKQEWEQRTGVESDDELDRENLEWHRKNAKHELDQFRKMWDQQAGDRFRRVELPEGVALIAFGFDIGNSLDVFDLVRDLQDAGVLRAAGFTNQPEAVSRRWPSSMPWPRMGL